MLEIIDYKVKVVLDKGGAVTSDVQAQEDGITYIVKGGENITFTASPKMRYALESFVLSADELTMETRPDDYTDKSFSKTFGLDVGNEEVLFGASYSYTLEAINSDMTLYINFAQLKWYDIGALESSQFANELTGYQNLGGINYDGRTIDSAYQITNASALSRVMYLINNNLSYTNSGKTYYYSDLYYKILPTAAPNIDLSTRFWTPVANKNIMFSGAIVGGNSVYAENQVTIKGISVDPENFEDCENGVGFIAKTNGAYISNLNLEDINVEYELLENNKVGTLVGHSISTTINNVLILSGYLKVNTTSENIVGGIVGLLDNNSVIFKSQNKANLILTDTSVNNVVGGIVGVNNGLINSVINNGQINNNNFNVVGGLVGRNNNTIAMSLQNGLIISANTNFGTLIGSNDINIDIDSSYFITGNSTDLEGNQISGINEKPIGNQEDNQNYDISPDKLQLTSAYVGFNFNAIYNSNINALGPQFKYSVVLNTETNMTGSGTEADPYLIGTALEFNTFIKRINRNIGNTPQTYYSLAANIDLSIYVMETINEFNANLTGAGFTITGLQISKNASSDVAFVNVNNGVIRNLTLVDSVFTGDNNISSIAVTNNGIIHGIVFNGVVIGRNNVAGIVVNNNGSLVRLGNNGYVAGNNNVAGLVSNLNESNVDNYNDAYDFSYNNNTLVMPYNGLTESYNRGYVFGNNNVGGLIANAINTNKHLAIKNVYNTGRVSGVTNIGGIVGNANNADIRFAYNYSDILTFDDNATDVTDVNAGQIIGNANNVTIGYVNDGNMLGVAFITKDNRNVKFVKQGNSVVGNGIGNSSATNDNRIIAYGYTTLQSQTTYTAYDFDFSNIWKFYDVANNFNYRLPILKYFHSQLITVTTNEFGTFEAEEYNENDNQRTKVNPNTRGEIYVLNGNNLAINFTADPHYHVYKQIVDGVETIVQKADDPITGVPDNSTKTYEYVFENIMSAHKIYAEFVLDRYKFTLTTNPVSGNTGNVVGTISGDGIYNYGEEVTFVIDNIDHFKLLGLDNLSKTNVKVAFDNNSKTVADGVYNILSQDDFNSGDFETTKLSLSETRTIVEYVDDNGITYELNYSTNKVTIKFMASDYAASGDYLEQEGCFAYGNYVANFVEQFDINLSVETYFDINSLNKDTGEVGGNVVGQVNNNRITDNNGYGLVDAGSQVVIQSIANTGYYHVDYTDKERDDPPTFNIISTEERFVTDEVSTNLNFVSNFERLGYEIKLILGDNGKVTVYEYDYNQGYIPTVTYSNAGEYSTIVKHGYHLILDVESKPGYAIESVTPINLPIGTTVSIPDDIYFKKVRFSTVVGRFLVDMKFRREVWTDHPSESLQGSGTLTDPYLITNGHDLGYIANQVNITGETYSGKYFKVTPIDENGNATNEINLERYYWNPIGIIGDQDKQFMGNIIGNFKSFNNIKIETAASFVGFFTEFKGEIANLNFNNVSLISSSAGSVVGGIAAQNSGNLINIQLSGSVQGAGAVGGLVGTNKSTGNLIKVRNLSAVTSFDNFAGGIAAENQGTIKDALNSGVVTNNNNYAGGIVGYNSNYGAIERASNLGNIIAKTAGGIVGFTNSGIIIDSFNGGSINASVNGGGIVGHKDSSVEENLVLTRVYNYGIVRGSNFGGIFGSAQTGTVNKFEDVYYLNTYSGSVGQTGAISKSLTELRSIRTFTNFDFNNVWGIDDNFNNKTPYLRSANTWNNWKDFATEIIPDENGVYHITSAEELAWVSAKTNEEINFSENKKFVLDNDIDLFGCYFTPIGYVDDTNSYAFKGIFDGNNHSINGLTIESNYQELNNVIGLFGYVLGNNETLISNANLNNIFVVNATGIEKTGALVGYIKNANVNGVNLNIEVKSVQGVVKQINDALNNAYIGSLIGEADSSEIKQILSDLNVYANSKNVTLGGLVGLLNNNSLIDQVAYSGNIIANRATNVGSIIGEGGNTNVTLTNAYFNGTLSATDVTNVGGIAGLFDTTQTLKYTYANPSTFNVTGTNIGGIIGNVTTYTPVEVTETDTFAYNYYSQAMGLNVKQGVGVANGTNYLSFNDLYYLDRAEMKNSLELKTESTYKTWNFDTIWAIDYESTNLNSGYPLFFYNNNYQIVNVTVNHEYYEDVKVEYGEVIRRNFNNDGTQSTRIIKTHATTEQVYVLNGNYSGFDISPYRYGLIDTVLVDGIVQSGPAQTYVEFAKTTSEHSIVVNFSRQLYEITINGVITADEGLTVDDNVVITAVLRNITTGTPYVITLKNGESKTLFDIERGEYVLVVNPPMFYDAYSRLGQYSTPADNVLRKSTVFELLPQTIDSSITVTINKSYERWLNDSSNNF